MKRSELKELIREIVIEPEESNRSAARIERFIQSQEAKNILSGQSYPEVIPPKEILSEFRGFMLDEDTDDKYKSNPAAVLKAIVDAHDNAVGNFYDDLADKINELEDFIKDFVDIKGEA